MRTYKGYIKRTILVIQKFIPFSWAKFIQKKIIYKPRIKKLGIASESDIPLFNAVFFEVRTKCNGSCQFCAASVQNEIRKDMSMPIDLYKKVS